MRRAPRFVAASAAMAVALALSACGGSGGSDTGGDGTPPPNADVSRAPDFPVTVGTTTLTAKPAKIVSLSPTTTEMLFAIGAGQQVTAVDDQSNYPAEAPKTDLSGYQPNAEAIAAKNPDLVVVSNDTNKIVDQLTQLKIPVYLAAAGATLDDSYQEITDLGALTGNKPAAEDLAKQMQTDIDKLVTDVPTRSTKLTYYYELGPELYSLTSKTFVGSLFAKVGMDNIADPADKDGSKGGYPQLGAESLVAADPDMIFLADTKCCKQSAATVTARSGWSGITAVKTKQIVPLDDDIASRWGPRVVDLVRQIVEAVSKVPA
jgi:iron complex transport system substrate-binding protein